MPNAYAGGVTLANSYDGWDSVGTRQLTDPDGDSVYTGAFRIPAGTRLEYKFVQGYNGSGTWETVPVDCGFTTPGRIPTVSMKLGARARCWTSSRLEPVKKYFPTPTIRYAVPHLVEQRQLK